MKISPSVSNICTVVLVMITALLMNGCYLPSKGSSEQSPIFRVNQVGYLTNGQKQAVLVQPNRDSFEILNTNEQIVYTAALLPAATWQYSQEEVAIADFSDFQESGTFQLRSGGVKSHPFQINAKPYDNLLKASIKAYYYNRASTALEAKHAGEFARKAGHPDTAVQLHVSAVDTHGGKDQVIKAPFGWYDAGDYNKYVVNSGITTYTLLLALEHYESSLLDMKLNIPESNNANPDILDEVLWNLRWMEQMQDPNDGGVYHKLTTANFEGFVPPHDANSTRYVVAKGTAASLNFAAVLARSYHSLKEVDSVMAKRLLNKAEYAWSWASKNPHKAYTNSTEYPAVKTGEYGDKQLQDEFLWAATELYLATEDEQYLAAIDLEQFGHFSVPNWASVETLAIFSLASCPDLPNTFHKQVSDKLLQLAKAQVEKWRASAYRVPIDQFQWGSNSYILNQAMVMINAYRLVGHREFFEAAQSCLDYVLGKNATGYCFVTGFGVVSPQRIHHRLSEADGIAAPIPGWLVGGPNPHNRSQDCGLSYYPDTAPAKCYIDELCSYSTNEIAINWNAPLVYVAAAMKTLYEQDFNVAAN
ncbi:glycoside hydrolase family 9 protein [Marinoscillum furvescens]|nr:glycoside hydrolase family 9 protein [Marinoscillum furvescens]